MTREKLVEYMQRHPKFVASYFYRHALLHDFDVEELTLCAYAYRMCEDACKAYSDFERLKDRVQVVGVMQMVIKDVRLSFHKVYGKP